ncbi:hypothetical protein SAMN05428944_7848 [Streptomyces sp. 1222.5]|uniref:hypothetical protein n=1 Tax=unclassified Streptomyces TaxID=2593676 RepID=UPI000898AE9E|nr:MULTISPECIES: hypothetical protein [unclassified Streptomyces]PKW05162.1 hypothetical protein BX260_0236 [Streptomyces sp. 5112.2]SED48712.1 hypothetical protein SAMN05428944_7848 [Streptomyces sp. 1222.5]
MPTPAHVLAAPVDEGGEFVFAHAFDRGIRVRMRGLTCRVDERPRRLRGVVAPLYGGIIRGMEPLQDFVADFVEHAVDDPHKPLPPGRIRDTRPVVARTGSDTLSSRMHFSYSALSPLPTVGPWDGAAAELLLSQRPLPAAPAYGVLRHGPAGAPRRRRAGHLPAAVISRERAEHIAAYLQARAGQVLHRLGQAARR